MNTPFASLILVTSLFCSGSMAATRGHASDAKNKSSAKVAVKTSWVDEALRLTGESDFVRERSLTRLKARPSLKSELRAGLNGENRALAIDVIVALKMKEFLPELLKVSKSDRDGFLHFAIYALTDQKTKPRVVAFLKKRLTETGSDSLRAGAKVATLDTLSLWREPVPVGDLLWLLSDDSPEVRMASVSFAKSFLLDKSEPNYAWVIEKAAQSEPYQLRLRAYYAAADVPKSKRSSLQRLVGECAGDKRSEVRDNCPVKSRGVM